ncbi:MAG TPA: MauE/DoxX family redox-associated membrane protein [Kofleriaceae bacterium]
MAAALHIREAAEARFAWLSANRVVALRWLLVLCQAATIVTTWPLWQVRESPPLLPAVGLPQMSVGIALLATLVLVLRAPRVGVALHVALLLYAFVADQTRLQPQFVSLALLLFGTCAVPAAGPVARAHLISLWIWSGLNKALSVEFIHRTALLLFDNLPFAPSWLRGSFGWLIIVSETTVGLCLLVPPLRRAGVVLAFLVHGMILLVLVPERWSLSVWPWNVALPLSAAVLFWPRAAAPEVAWSPRRARLVLAALLIFPAGFYGGWVDAYLAHHVYSDTGARGLVCREGEGCSPAPFKAPYLPMRALLPPEPRLFVAHFDAICRPGDRLVVYPRRVRIRFGRNTEPLRRACPVRPPAPSSRTAPPDR